MHSLRIKDVNAPLFTVAEEGVGKGWGTGDCPPELMLSVSKGRLDVVPSTTVDERVVLPMALAPRVAPRKALPSTSASPSRSSALKACCTHTHLSHDLLTDVSGRQQPHYTCVAALTSPMHACSMANHGKALKDGVDVC